jgi:hypothetical protein
METLAELPFIGDQVVCLSHEPGRPQRNAIPGSEGAPGGETPPGDSTNSEGSASLRHCRLPSNNGSGYGQADTVVRCQIPRIQQIRYCELKRKCMIVWRKCVHLRLIR